MNKKTTATSKINATISRKQKVSRNIEHFKQIDKKLFLWKIFDKLKAVDVPNSNLVKNVILKAKGNGGENKIMDIKNNLTKRKTGMYRLEEQLN